MTARSEGPTLGVDVGGTKIAFAFVEGGRCFDRSQASTPRTGRGADLVAAVAAEVARRRPARLAVATTGLVGGGRLTAVNPETLAVEKDFPLRAALADAVGLTPLLVNDAQAAAWGEFRFGAGRGADSFAFLTVSTGVGGGVVAEGRLIAGRKGLAGHVGHMVVDPKGPPCGCGRKGCLEAIASGSAIARRASAHADRTVTAPDVFAAARKEEAWAGAIVDDAAKAVAAVIGDLVAALDLDRVALGGGVGLAESFLNRVVAAVGDLPFYLQRPVVPAEAGADAGLIGAGALLDA